MTRPDHTPDDPRIFVFGSNLFGIHGAGAALYARRCLGAGAGVGEGLTGRAYALPTCSRPGVKLDLSKVEHYVDRFIDCARSRTDLQFYVSEVGCGLAGFTTGQIAPMFRYAPQNCDLPENWKRLT